MDLWIPLTVAAAGIQAVRTALQRKLTDRLTVFGATFARFLFGLPIVLTGLMILVSTSGQSIPNPNGVFVGYAWGGGLAQLLGNALLLHLLGFSTFTVGTTYTKTEVVQTAAFSYLVLGDRTETSGLLGILIASAGVVLMAVARAGLSAASLVAAIKHKPAVYGICVGALYAVAAVFYRGAALALEDGGFVLRAITTLAWVTTGQAVFMAVYLRWRTPKIIAATLANWRLGVWVGLTGIVASACWYSAFTLQNAAYVMALGQVELIFTYAFSRLMFHERLVFLEAVGVAATILGIVLVVLAG